ncbi:MAG: hypothetical protein VB131_06850 [Burkholderia gladioli]
MTDIIIHLASAVICFSGSCYPALVGPQTPIGEFQVQRRQVAAPGYGGDVLAFAEDDSGVFAIHRVWLRRPAERRYYRLTRGSVSERRSITNGCVNVMPDVYSRLVDCCSRSRVVVTR